MRILLIWLGEPSETCVGSNESRAWAATGPMEGLWRIDQPDAPTRMDQAAVVVATAPGGEAVGLPFGEVSAQQGPDVGTQLAAPRAEFAARAGEIENPLHRTVGGMATAGKADGGGVAGGGAEGEIDRRAPGIGAAVAAL